LTTSGLADISTPDTLRHFNLRTMF
jgi:hypothetical protein